MKKLGEQWVEVIDGQEHMVKAVEPVFDCQGCMYLAEEGCVNSYLILNCGIGKRFIIKDLGILKDGLLACPFCGEYTEILKGKLGYRIRHVCRDSYVMAGTGIYETEQEAIDAWNRRA